MMIAMKGDVLTVTLNGRVVIENAQLPAFRPAARSLSNITAARSTSRISGLVVNSTRLRVAQKDPTNFYPNGGYQNFRNVLAGGGNAARASSSWAVMMLPGLRRSGSRRRQPAHACHAYKAANPMTQPQPGSAWKVAYGRGWEVSRDRGDRSNFWRAWRSGQTRRSFFAWSTCAGWPARWLPANNPPLSWPSPGR